LDQRRAAFDKLRLRNDFSANTGLPHAELVEARRALMQALLAREEAAMNDGKAVSLIIPGLEAGGRVLVKAAHRRLPRPPRT
jgi:hypothetical protein